MATASLRRRLETCFICVTQLSPTIRRVSDEGRLNKMPWWAIVPRETVGEKGQYYKTGSMTLKGSGELRRKDFGR